MAKRVFLSSLGWALNYYNHFGGKGESEPLLVPSLKKISAVNILNFLKSLTKETIF